MPQFTPIIHLTAGMRKKCELADGSVPSCAIPIIKLSWETMRIIFLAALLCNGAGAASGAWLETLTPHFRIEHQRMWLQDGLIMGAEGVHSRLRFDLEAFTPWMATRRINFFLYRDLDSFIHGEFSPPPWSIGLAVYDRNAVVMPGMQTTKETLRVFAHESTHLLFVGYFHERHRDPPSWINEGLATNEEAPSADRPETSQWYQDMVATASKSWYPMARFFGITPTRDLDNDQAAVGLWYIQAYSVTHFLLRAHTRMQFKDFCDDLRDGGSVESALKRVYHFHDVADFERAWRVWLADPVHRRRVAALRADEIVQSDGIIRGARGWSRSFSSFGDFEPLTLPRK